MKKRYAWLLCLCWMVFIFVMSAQPGDVSGRQSGVIVDLIEDALDTLNAPEVGRDTLQHIVRKGAHMTEYAVLFLLYRWALVLSGARHPGTVALLLCAAYAVTDEYHQSFVDARGPSPIDVLIDTSGAAISWIAYTGFRACMRRVRRSGG